ncbi:TonB-dependent receptor [Sphingobium terrigena]|uniref:TonB-dependent receptor n=1 Tax=Sphingobium terrigena TaxID=2304063 RepID=A0A418YL87_9SPHN|nr:TonB-dependent receptor [Sphingobium terrigena]RJG51734.1 TonB-dependent receptor [Sphingobium terrigena]
MKKSRNLSYIASAMAIAAFMASQPALAQQPADTAATDPQNRGLDEIVVTAQKRAENLQSTPIAVTAFNAAALVNKNVDDISGIAAFTPNLQFDATAPLSGASSAAIVFIRGVGKSGYQVTDDPGVGTYVDGVYVSSSVGGVLDVLDVERIEVLRGPQGTLFGRNTIGGAISITTKRPSEEPGGSLEATYGNYDRMEIRGSIDTPISEVLRTKLTFGYKRADGWSHLLAIDYPPPAHNNRSQRTPGDVNRGSGRLAVEYTPSDSFNFYLTADVSRIREATVASTALAVPLDGTLTAAYNAVDAAITDVPGYGTGVLYDDRWVVAPGNKRGTFQTGPNGTNLNVTGFAGTAEWKLADDLTLKSITAFRKVSGSFNRDADNSPLQIADCFSDFKQKQFSQEGQLLGTAFADRLDYIVGAYYFKESAVDDYRCALPPSIGTVILKSDADNSSYAAFGQASFKLMDDLKVTAGIRYTHDKKSLLPDFIYDPAAGGAFAGVRTVPYDRVTETFSNVSPRFSVDYKVSRDVLFYGSYSRGYKGGGFNARTVSPRADVLAFRPEKLATFEIGTKLEMLDRRVRLNLAAFTTKYQNLQITVIEGFAPGTQNGGDARIKGFEAELTAKPTEGLTLNASLAHLDTKYTKLLAFSPNVLPAFQVRAGNKLSNSPEWTASAGFDYRIPAAGIDGDVVLRGDWSYNSKIYNDDINSVWLTQSGYSIFNAQIAYENSGGNWDLVVWGKNLSDKQYIFSGDANAAAGFVQGNYSTPRTYGVTFRRRF